MKHLDYKLVFGMMIMLGLIGIVNASTWDSTHLGYNLTAYYNLNDTLDSLGVHDLTNSDVGSGTHGGGIFVAGKVGDAWYNNDGGCRSVYDGVGYMKPFFESNQTFSISFWHKKVGAYTSSLKRFWGFAQGAGFLQLLSNDTRGDIYTGYLGTDGYIGITLKTGIVSNDSVWHHVVFTYNGKGDRNTTIYVDDVLKNSTIMAFDYAILGHTFTIGCLIAGNDGETVYMDEFGIWNRILNQSDINLLWNGGAGTTYAPFILNTATLNSPADNVSSMGSITFNCGARNTSTAFVSNMSLYINDVLNLTQSGENLSTTLSFPAGNYNWTCKGETTTNIPFSASETRRFSITNFVINSVTYNPFTTSGLMETFAINFTYNNLVYNGLSVFLNYNNTNYTATSSDLGNNVLYSSTIQIPGVSSLTNKTFKFIVGLSNSSGITYTNSSSYNQTISALLIDNCSTSSHRLFNFTMVDEESLQPVNGTIEALINIYSHGTNNLISTFNGTINYIYGNASSICINNFASNVSSYDMSYVFKHYGNSSYFKRYNSIQKAVITNSISENLKLYELLTSSGYPFDIILVGNSFGNSGLLVEAQRQYLTQNTFNLVESSVSNAGGDAILHLVPNDVVYNFVVSYNGNIIKTFTNYRVQCQNPLTNQCTITLNLAESSGTIPSYENYLNISSYYYPDNVAKILYFYYTATDGIVKNVTMRVTKNDGYGNTTICYTGSIGTSGTLFCNIPLVYQNTSFWSTITVDGRWAGDKQFSMGVTPNYFGADVYIELLMYSSIVMLFLASPIMIVIGAMIGIFMVFALLFITGGTWTSIVAAIIYFIIGGFIVIYQLNKKM